VNTSSAPKASYSRNGLNGRIVRRYDSRSPGSPQGIDRHEHCYYNSAWQLLETRETTSSTTLPQDVQPKHQYVWSLTYIDTPVLRDENTDSDGLCDDGRCYYLHDANMNVVALTSTAGAVVERYAYDAYGKTTIYDGAWSATRSVSSYGNAITYTGRQYDPETGFLYFRYRYLTAPLGRFLSRDPLEYEAGDFNPSRYVKGCVLHMQDPFGLFAAQSDECRCGADVTGAFLSLVKRTLASSKEWGITRESPGLQWFMDKGMGFDWPLNQGAGCPSGIACANTQTLCGECVHSHWIGNFMYAFLLKLAGFGRRLIFFAGNAVQGPGIGDQARPGIQYVDPPWDTAGYDIAINFQHMAASSEQAFCQELKSNSLLWRQANDTSVTYRSAPRFHRSEIDVYPAPHAKGYLGVCKPCNSKLKEPFHDIPATKELRK